MKTKTFFLVSLFIGIGLTQTYAQPENKKGTGTIHFIETIVGNDVDIPIVCGGELKDVLNFPNSFPLRITDHYKNGEVVWSKYITNNICLTSQWTGEVFTTSDIENLYENGLFRWHSNMRGNLGHHYTVNMVFETTGWTIIQINTKCWVDF